MGENKKEHFLSNRNIKDSLFFSMLSIAMVIYSLKNHYSVAGLEWKMSPYLFPFLISIFIGILAITLFIEGLKEDKSLDEDTKETEVKWKDVISTIIISVIYYIVLRKIGFIISTILFLMALFIYLGEKRIWLISLISIVSTLAIYIIFGVLLHVMLP